MAYFRIIRILLAGRYEQFTDLDWDRLDRMLCAIPFLAFALTALVAYYWAARV